MGHETIEPGRMKMYFKHESARKMNPKLQRLLDHLTAEHGPHVVMPYRNVPRGAEGLLVELEDKSRLIYMFSEECLQDHGDSILLTVLQNTMTPLAIGNPNMEVFTKTNLEAEIRDFEA